MKKVSVASFCNNPEKYLALLGKTCVALTIDGEVVATLISPDAVRLIGELATCSEALAANVLKLK